MEKTGWKEAFHEIRIVAAKQEDITVLLMGECKLTKLIVVCMIRIRAQQPRHHGEIYVILISVMSDAINKIYHIEKSKIIMNLFMT